VQQFICTLCVFTIRKVTFTFAMYKSLMFTDKLHLFTKQCITQDSIFRVSIEIYCSLINYIIIHQTMYRTRCHFLCLYCINDCFRKYFLTEILLRAGNSVPSPVTFIVYSVFKHMVRTPPPNQPFFSPCLDKNMVKRGGPNGRPYKPPWPLEPQPFRQLFDCCVVIVWDQAA